MKPDAIYVVNLVCANYDEGLNKCYKHVFHTRMFATRLQAEKYADNYNYKFRKYNEKHYIDDTCFKVCYTKVKRVPLY